MRLSDSQQKILKTVTASSKVTAAELAETLSTRPGPAARSAQSLVAHGLLTMSENKAGENIYKRTAEGGKIAKILN